MIDNKEQLKDDTVFYNHSNQPVFITRKIVDLVNGHRREEKIYVGPGDGIDVSILGFKRGNPHKQEK